MDQSETIVRNTFVKAALLLAAGTGSRLSPLTDSKPKCLVEVNNISILERMIASLSHHGIERLFIVVGHMSEVIQRYLGSRYANIDITYIPSLPYKTTNNIYSLWFAGQMIDEPFLLVESDLVFQSALLKPMLQPDRIAVSQQLPWMNGTTVTLNGQHQLEAFWQGILYGQRDSHFKTVNIYSFSLNNWRLIWERLDQHISNGKVHGYYETVFAELVAEGNLNLSPVFFDSSHWYEIDTLEDLSAAEKIFPELSQVLADKSEHLSPLINTARISSPETIDLKDYGKRGVSMNPPSSLTSYH